MKSLLLPTAALVLSLAGIAAAQTNPPAKLDIKGGGAAEDNAHWLRM